MALGYRYLNGVDVQASCSIALRYYRQAAQVALDWLNAGHQDHDERAWLTDEDEIVSDKDLQDNFVFFQLAADYGDPGANAVMGNIYMNGLYGHRQNFDQVLLAQCKKRRLKKDPHTDRPEFTSSKRP